MTIVKCLTSKLVLLGAGSIVFYLGSFGHLEPGVHWGVYGGLYLVIGLILTIGHRVIPLFIERGVGYPVELFNSKWLAYPGDLEKAAVVEPVPGLRIHRGRLSSARAERLHRRVQIRRLHGFAYGGIGLITLSMMARVSLGHTGRDIHSPPRIACYALIALSLGAVFRVLLPIGFPGYHLAWVAASQVLWIVAFAALAAVLLPMLTSPGADSRFG